MHGSRGYHDKIRALEMAKEFPFVGIFDPLRHAQLLLKSQTT